MSFFSSFRGRLVTVLFALLLGAQAATYVLISDAASKDARRQVRERMDETTRTFQESMARRASELRLGVRLLSSDYAFASTFSRLRESKDPVTRETLRSALQNYQARIGTASFLRLSSLDGERIADTLAASFSESLSFEKSLIEAAENSDALEASSVEVLDDSLHFVVLRPLLMPEPSAWIAVGFPLDASVAEELGRLSHLEIGFLLGGRLLVAPPGLPAGDWVRAISEAPSVAGSDLLTVSIGGSPYLVRIVAFPGDSGGAARVVMLRSLDAELAPFRRLERRLLIVNGIALAASLLVAFVVAGGVTRPVVALSKGVSQIEQGNYRARVPQRSRDEVGKLASAFNRMAEGLEERDKVRDLLGKAVSPEIARELLSTGVELGGEVREATVLFTDLRGFTAFSETQTPKELVMQLNEYFTAVSTAVEASGGIVDKFIGDAVMAVFGAPTIAADHADRAMAAALAALRAEKGLNVKRVSQGLPPLQTGIGISSGPLLAGNIGSPSRSNYTVIGNEVNLASRLESLTKETSYRARIICSDATRKALTLPLPLRDLGEVTIRGKEHPIRIWSLDLQPNRVE